MNSQIHEPNNDGMSISRRGFFKGAAAMIAAGAPLLLQTSCSSPSEGSSDLSQGGSDSKLSVSVESVFTTDACEYIEDTDSVFKIVSKANLPYKTLLRAGDDHVAATLVPGETSTPLTKVGILKLDDADHRIVLENSIGASEGYEIFNACASAQGIAWIEQNVLQDSWRLYIAPLSGMSLGSPMLVDEGRSSWVIPSMACVGDYAFWQLTPQSSAARTALGGHVMRQQFSQPSDEPYGFFECSPKFACDISKDSSGIVISYYDEDASSYALEHVDADSGEVTDTLILPSPIKPTYIGYGNTGFSFALEDIYSNDGAIGNIGTYTSAGSDDGWFRFPRTPLCGPAWASQWFLVKSTSVVAGIDLKDRRYFSIEPENANQDYGEFLASSGDCKRIVTYSNIDYTPLNGERIKACQVRIWEPA